jgi:uncharacterized integral membrane protein
MAEHEHPARTRRQQVRSVVAMAAGVYIVLFAVLNTQDVTIHWVFGTSRTPLIVAIVLSAVLGFVLGLAVPRLRERSRRR